MRPENVQNTYEYSEAAEDASPAASVSEMMNRETPTSKLWPFLGGLVIGAAGVITTALVADALTYGTGARTVSRRAGRRSCWRYRKGAATRNFENIRVPATKGYTGVLSVPGS